MVKPPGSEAASTMEFFGTYVEVTPPERLVWTNEEGASVTVTTVTFTEQGGATVVTRCQLYPSKEALDAAGAHGQAEGPASRSSSSRSSSPRTPSWTPTRAP